MLVVDVNEFYSPTGGGVRTYIDRKMSIMADMGHELICIACGKEDNLIKSNRQFKSWLASRNIKFESVETEGAHTWQVWRRNLTDLVPLLFK